jgi:cyclase
MSGARNMPGSNRIGAISRGCCIAGLLGWGFTPALQAQAPDLTKVEYRSEKLTDNLFVLFGGGGNVAVLTGVDGALVVDADFVELAPKLRAAVSLISDEPVRFLIDTHFHMDHAGGNTTLGREGAVIVAHENVRKHLMTRQTVNIGTEIVTEPSPREGLPVVTFKDGLRLHFNDEVVEVVHVGEAHTDSDSLVFFEHANVLHTGDIFMSIGFPFIDVGNGGSLDGLIAGITQALKFCDGKTRVIPGHGAVSGAVELRAYLEMLVTVRQRVAELVKKGRSVEQVLAANPTREFDERWGKGFVTTPVFVQRVFIEQMKDRKKG